MVLSCGEKDPLEEDLAAVDRLRRCEYPGNAPHELGRYEAEQRMRDLWFVFNYIHPDPGGE